MRTDIDIQNYKSYLKDQIDRLSDKSYGTANRSLLDTYRTKLEVLNYLTREGADKNDKLSICKWLMG